MRSVVRRRGGHDGTSPVRFTPKIQERRKRLVRAAMRCLLGESGDSGQASATLPRAGIHKILICRSVHTLCDSLTLTPLLHELSEIYPGAEIDIVNGSAVAGELYGKFFSVRRIFQLPAHAARHPLRTVLAIRAMRRNHYDLVIDPDPESQIGRLLALLADAGHSLGFSGPMKSGELTHEVAIPAEPRHKGTMPVYLLRTAIGDVPAQRVYPRLDIRLSAAERRQGRHILDRLKQQASDATEVKGTIGIYAFATGGKDLGSAWWNRFLRVFEPAAAGYSIIEILPAFGCSPLGSRHAGFFSSDIRKLASVLGNLSLYISADCGVMHLASAAGAPTVGIFTITPLSEWGPYGHANRAIDARRLAPEEDAVNILAILGVQAAIPRTGDAACEYALPAMRTSFGV